MHAYIHTHTHTHSRIHTHTRQARIIAVKDVGKDGTLRRGRAMPIFVYAAQGLLTAGQMGPMKLMFKGWKVFVETAGMYVCIYVCMYVCSNI